MSVVGTHSANSKTAKQESIQKNITPPNLNQSGKILSWNYMAIMEQRER